MENSFSEKNVCDQEIDYLALTKSIYEFCQKQLESDIANIDKLTTKPPVVYRSFNEFINHYFFGDEYDEKLKNASFDPNNQTSKLHRLHTICKNYGITLSLFKESKQKYLMTSDVVCLFAYLLITIDDKYATNIRNKSPELNSDDLVILRETYYDALGSMSLDCLTFNKALKLFDEKTKYLPHVHCNPLSEITTQVLEYLEQVSLISLSESEKYQLGQAFDYDFRYQFYPSFVTHCEKLFKDFLENKNIPCNAFDDDSMEDILRVWHTEKTSKET